MAGEKAKRKFKIKRILGYFLTGFIFLSVFVDFYLLFHHTYTQSYKVRLEETGQQIAGSVRRNMEDAVIFVKAAATVFRDYEDIHCEEAVEAMILIDRESNFTRMWLTKAGGEAVSSEGKTSDAAGRAYLEDGLAGNSGISEIQYSRVNGEKNVTVYAPIRHGDEITGLIIGIYRLEELLENVDVKCFGRDGYCRLVKENGEVIVEGMPEGEASKTFEGKNIDYLCPVGINDWWVYIRLPGNILMEDLKGQGIFYLLISMKLMFVLLCFILDKYHTKKIILEKLAKTDSLTELWNRKTIEEKINSCLSAGGQKNHVLVVLDVDRFKKVNDTEGHLAGDILIKRIAAALEDTFGDIGIVSRMGGDEFAVFLPAAEGRDTIQEVRERIEKLFAEVDKMAEKENWKCSISLSVGAAVATEEKCSFEALYGMADNKMYEAKNIKGNSVFY